MEHTGHMWLCVTSQHTTPAAHTSIPLVPRQPITVAILPPHLCTNTTQRDSSHVTMLQHIASSHRIPTLCTSAEQLSSNITRTARDHIHIIAFNMYITLTHPTTPLSPPRRQRTSVKVFLLQDKQATAAPPLNRGTSCFVWFVSSVCLS